MSNLDFENMPMDEKRKMLDAILGDPTVFPDTFKNWLPNYLGVNPPDINIDQVNGYQENSATAGQTINLLETTTSISYTNLTTPGPLITGFTDGNYIVTYGCAAMISSAATRARANVSINSAPPDDNVTPQIYTSVSTGMVGISAQTVLRFSAGLGNTIRLLYAVGSSGTGQTATFDKRYLSIVRVSQ
jgi:hypothetical protein